VKPIAIELANYFSQHKKYLVQNGGENRMVWYLCLIKQIFKTMNRVKRIVSIDTQESLNLIHVVIGSSSDYLLVNEYSNMDRAIRMLSKDLPDMVLVDVSIPQSSGSDSIKKIKETLPYIDIIVVSASIDDRLIKDCIASGASGFIEKNKEWPSKLLSYLTEVAQGGVAMSPKPMRRLVESLWISPFSPLTKRETEILRLMSDGCTYTEIGKTLRISAETSKTHIRNIYKKLKVNKKSNALDKARMDRLV